MPPCSRRSMRPRSTVRPERLTGRRQDGGIASRTGSLIVRYVPSPPAADAPAAGPTRRESAAHVGRGFQKLVMAQAPAAIVVLVPDEAKDHWERVAFPFTRGTYALDPDGTAEQRTPARGTPLLYVRESAVGTSLPAEPRLVASIFTDSFTYPSVNVVAKVTWAGCEAARRARAVQRSPGPRRRSLHRQRRQHLERRRRQRDDGRGVAGDRPRDGGAAGAPVRALHLARRRGTRADGLSLVREASDRSAEVDRRRPQRRHDRPQRPERRRRSSARCRRTGTRRSSSRWRKRRTRRSRSS